MGDVAAEDRGSMTAEVGAAVVLAVATLDPVAVSDAIQAHPPSVARREAVSGQAVTATAAPLPVQDRAAATKDAISDHREAMGARAIAVVAPEDGRMTAPGLHRAVVSKRLQISVFT